MTIDIEFLLARHPLLFFWWECRVKGFDSGGVLAAVGGGGRNVHPLSAVKRARNKFRNEQGGGEVTVHNKANVLLFAAHKSTADVVAGIPKIDVHIVTHLARDLKGMVEYEKVITMYIDGSCSHNDGIMRLRSK